MTDTQLTFKARDIGLRAQKKILSRMANKTVAKTFIDDSTASLLDNIYRLAKIHVRLYYPHDTRLTLSTNPLLLAAGQQARRRTDGQEHDQNCDKDRDIVPQRDTERGGAADGR